MEKFYEHLCKKNPNGIPYAEARQLMLWMFLTISYLPQEFRELELSKVNLANLFKNLSINKKIIISQTDKVCFSDIANQEHWESLVDLLLQKAITLDESFPVRFVRYV